MIKIIAIITSEIGSGGGFDQSLNAIVQMQRLSINRFRFEVCTTHKSNISICRRLGIQAMPIEISILDRILSNLSQNIFWQTVQWRLKLIGPLEKTLLRYGCDVVYFLTPENLCSSLQKLNYINTLWDLCHRETPEFPEVRDFNAFYIRENNSRHNFGPALVTLTDSTLLADMSARFYGVDRRRFIAMPFSPAPFMDKMHAISNTKIIKKYSLETGYFYYPAQLWPHKNHIRILQALKILRDEQAFKPNVVFSGKDYGNRAHIENFIQTNQLESQVKILGFVPSADMRGLYENAIAIVMPTYFGPTNLPPLEAWSIGVPLIYSAQLIEQTGNAALLVDPDNAIELAEAMLQCTKSEIRDRLIRAGHQRLAEIADQRISAEEEICKILEKFAARRECWGNNDLTT